MALSQYMLTFLYLTICLRDERQVSAWLEQPRVAVEQVSLSSRMPRRSESTTLPSRHTAPLFWKPPGRGSIHGRGEAEVETDANTALLEALSKRAARLASSSHSRHIFRGGRGGCTEGSSPDLRQDTFEP